MLQKKDFIEIEFVGKTLEGDVFDTNVAEELKKINPDYSQEQIKPFVFALGEGMFLPGVDDFLVGKPEEKKSYKIELNPDTAFGTRQRALVQIMPTKIFHQHKQNPVPGMMFNFDGRMGKILSASGGRVTVDFNHPLAGKKVIYDVNVLRKIENTDEKVRSFLNFLFRRDLKFEIKEKTLVVEAEKQMLEFVKLFSEKFKEILDLNLEVKEIADSVKKAEKEMEKEIEKVSDEELEKEVENAVEGENN